MDKYSVRLIDNNTGILSREYYGDEINHEEFYKFVETQVMELQSTNAITNLNLAFIDNNSNMRYYSAKDLSQAKRLIFDGNLDEEFGGSDTVPENFAIILSTRKFRINYIDGRGGASKHKSKYYTCLDIESTENNCLIECFNFLTGLDYDPKEVREKLGFEPEGTLGNKHMLALEKFYDLNVCVKLDEFDIKKDMGRIYTTARIVWEREPETPSWLLLKDNHYSIILDTNDEEIRNLMYSVIAVPEKLKSKKNQRNSVYYFFDYETIWDADTYKLEPYSFAIIKTDKDGKILDERFAMKDTKSIIEYLQKESIVERNNRKILVGFNNSRFDNFMLLETMIHNNPKKIGKVMFVENTILNMEILKFNVTDLCRILNSSLDKACKSFHCEQQKLSLSHSEVQSMHNEGKLEEYLKENQEHIKDYNLMDVKTLAELYFKTKNTINNLCKVDMSEFHTLAGMSYKIFRSLNKSTQIPLHGHSERAFIRRSVVGGRAQIFNKGEFASEPLCCIDCVSLYPYAMLNNVFPVGKIEITEKYITNKIGVYEVKIKNQPKINIIPLRNQYDSLNWEIKEDMEITILSEDLDMLRKYGCEVEVIHGIYWNKDEGQIFKSYFNPLVKEKKRQDLLKESNDSEYNPSIRELCKLLMNSLSGKLIQRDYERVVEIIKTKEGLNNFREKCENGIEVLEVNDDISIVQGKLQEYENPMPTIYGALIYSYARSHMYDSVLSKVDYNQLYGMDTDSAFITVRQYNKLKQEYPEIFGDEFGQFKEEVIDLIKEGEEGPYGIFVAPKCYCFYVRDKKTGNERFIKARFKGINIFRDRIWDSSKNFQKMSAKEIHELYYGDDLKKIDVDFYRECLKRNVIVLHSNLNKTIVNKEEYINIKQHFCLKVIKHQ